MPNTPPTHKPRQRAHQTPQRAHSAARGYCHRWREFRRVYLALHPLCRVCERAGRLTAAAQVDHVVPLAAGGAKYDDANLQPLCATCHSRKTNARDGGLGRKKEWDKRA